MFIIDIKTGGWLDRRSHARFNDAYDERWNAVRDFIGGRPYPREQMRATMRSQMQAARRRRQELPLERAQARVAREMRRHERLTAAQVRRSSTRARDSNLKFATNGVTQTGRDLAKTVAAGALDLSDLRTGRTLIWRDPYS